MSHRTDVTTVAHLLARVAERSPERGFTFIDGDTLSESFVSFAELHEQASRHAAAFAAHGVRRGDRIVMALPDERQFVAAFFGAIYGGFIPVPIYPPLTLGRLGSYLDHVEHIVRRSGAVGILTDRRVRRVLGSLLGGALRWIAVPSELDLDAAPVQMTPLGTEEPAFIQFTSGSTAHPKGVVLPHRALLANTHAISYEGFDVTPDDVGCSWLPLYHDMGLIGFVIASLWQSTPVVFLPPLLFLKRPAEWLRAMAKHRATITVAPNFAYGLATKRVRERDLEGIDLSHVRIAGCGAEPIQIDTLEAFADRFAQVGFRREAFMPCYGLAEASLAVTIFDTTRPAQADRILVEPLVDERRAVPAPPDSNGEAVAAIVNCGRWFREHEVRIVDEEGNVLPERRVGEIVVRGPSLMAGYYDDEEATRQALRDGWLHTGDMGYLAEGELHVCGRIKDVIIVAGRNYYPTDIEWAAEQIPGIRRGNVVAFGLPAPAGGHEQVVVVAETRETDPARLDELGREVRAKVLESVGLRVDDVVLLPPSSLPKTSSGKLQRRRTRQLYIDGALQEGRHRETRKDLLRHVARSQVALLRQRLRNTLDQVRGRKSP